MAAGSYINKTKPSQAMADLEKYNRDLFDYILECIRDVYSVGPAEYISWLNKCYAWTDICIDYGKWSKS